MSYELILRASYENNKEVLYKSPNIDGDFVIRGYTNPNDAPPLHRAGIINDACFNLLSSTNTYPNVSIDTINTSNATLASEDFTISFWCNIQKDSIAQNTVLFSATDGDNYSWSTTKGTFLLLGNPVRLLYDNTTYLTSKNTLKLVDGKNHFICIERKNDTLYVFIDGKLEIEDDITTRFGVAHYPFANVKFSVGNGGAEDSDGTRTLKRSMLVDGYTLIKGICIWDKEFTPPKRDAWDLISNGYLDTTGLAYYHNKIVEYINKNSIVRQNNHLYNKDDIVRFNNMWIKCMIGGTTASTPPTLTTEEIGTTITDGGVTWTVVKYALTTDVPPLASALATPRKIELTGKAEGSTSFDGSTNASINVTSVNADTASKLTTARTINITGNATGSADFDGTSDVNINVMVNSATKATQDSAGQQINTTYLKGLSISGQTITYTRGNNTTGTITTQDTVYTHPNSGVTAGTYKSVTVNAQGHVTAGSNPTTLSGYGITDAPTKTGGGASGTWGINVSGNSATATKATQDSAGQQINTTYIKGLSVSGATLTITKGNGVTSTATINQTAEMLPATRVLQGGGTKLYSYNQGLESGDITLSQAFTNFKYLVIFMGNEGRGQHLHASTVETVALYQAMAGNATYWPGNLCASNAETLWLTEDSHYVWAIYNIKGGSSTTYFKYSTTSADDTTVFSIYGIN